MRVVGNHRGTRTIGLALLAGLLSVATVLVLGAAVWSPDRVLVNAADENVNARKTQGGETVISKLEEEEEPEAASAVPIRLKGLGDIPWNREETTKDSKPKARVFAGNAKAADALPWDAVEPVPFTPTVAHNTVKRKTSVPETEPETKLAAAAPKVASPNIALPASGEVERWVKAKAKTLKGENRGRPIYHFEFWLDVPAAIKDRLVAVTYDFNTPAVLPQSQISNEEKTGFRVAVGGLACSDNVTVTLKFDDGRSQQAEVDGCRLLS